MASSNGNHAMVMCRKKYIDFFNSSLTRSDIGFSTSSTQYTNQTAGHTSSYNICAGGGYSTSSNGSVEIKEIRLSLNIDTHDFETKGNQAIKFLKSGNKIKVSIRFRGREMGHQNIGLDNMTRFAEYCSEYGNIEKPAKLEGRNMLMFLAPKSVEK